MLDFKELYWAAGFIEGDGSFTSFKGMPRVKVGQKHKPPLERLLSLFGGKIYLFNRKHHGHRVKFWSYDAAGPRAVGIMMTLHSNMSPRRKEQIQRAIQAWKDSPGKGHKRGGVPSRP